MSDLVTKYKQQYPKLWRAVVTAIAETSLKGLKQSPNVKDGTELERKALVYIMDFVEGWRYGEQDAERIQQAFRVASRNEGQIFPTPSAVYHATRQIPKATEEVRQVGSKARTPQESYEHIPSAIRKHCPADPNHFEDIHAWNEWHRRRFYEQITGESMPRNENNKLQIHEHLRKLRTGK